VKLLLALLCACGTAHAAEPPPARPASWAADVRIPAQTHETVTQASADLTALFAEHSVAIQPGAYAIQVRELGHDGLLAAASRSWFVEDRGAGAAGRVTGRIVWPVPGVAPERLRRGPVFRTYRIFFGATRPLDAPQPPAASDGDAAPPCPTPNLLRLGGFEQPGLAAYRQRQWSFGPGVALSARAAHTGRRALSIRVPDGEQSTHWSTPRLRVSPGQQYGLSMWWKAEEASGDYIFTAFVYYYDEDGKLLLRTTIAQAAEPSFDWWRVRRQVEIPEKVAFLATGAASRCRSGALFVDDVRVTPYPVEIREIRGVRP